ncbi:hypothetical protein AYI69_g156 [Smittium culicis]|uniref:Uncharacterized protein n=1 Tax=Smittium culicis TaxID=133412 RepID=A0A1R1YTT3_9FUNG|nr:hypothetical protein AYI69_g156 [Smittium culicis]
MQQAGWKSENSFKKYYFKPNNEIAYSSTSAIFKTTNTPIIERTLGPEEQSRRFEKMWKIVLFYGERNTNIQTRPVNSKIHKTYTIVFVQM